MKSPPDHQAEPTPRPGGATAPNLAPCPGETPAAASADDAGQPTFPDVLLAVDLGLRAGLAWFNRQGRLLRCRSTHFADRGALRRALPAIWQEVPGVAVLVLEGGGDLAEIWLESARRRAVATHVVTALDWRAELLFQREQRSGVQAKAAAGRLCQKVMRWSGYTRPGLLVHDASEAVLCGLWMAHRLGWLPQWPPELRGQN